MVDKQVEGLGIGEVALRAADPAFEHQRIASPVEHTLVVVGLQESGVTFRQVACQLMANRPDIGKYPYGNIIACYHKTQRFGSIVPFREGSDSQLSHANVFMRRKWLFQRRVDLQPAVAVGQIGDKDRNSMFFGEHLYAPGMVGMFVGDEDGLDGGDFKTQAGHAPFGFAAGDAGIHQHRLVLCADEIAVAVAA